MKLFVVVVDVVVVVVVVFLTETNDTTKRVDLQPSKFCPPRRRRLLSQEGIGFYKALIVGLISVGLHHLWLCLRGLYILISVLQLVATVRKLFVSMR